MMKPRYPGEYFIFEYLKEVDRYAALFRDRVARAFDGLENEAKRIEEDEYSRLSASFDPDHGDRPYGAEKAYFAGVEYYLTTDAVRHGVYNLLIAGLFHLLEQQSQYLVTPYSAYQISLRTLPEDSIN
jgi:hypothetical protein